MERLCHACREGFDWVKAGDWKWNHPELSFVLSLNKRDGWQNDPESIRDNLRER